MVLSPDLKKVLVIYHLRSKGWQQPGGHWDEGEAGPWLTAEREAIEESGVSFARRLIVADDERVPLHIITGPVWPNAARDETHHWHHDFRYGFIAKSEELGDVEDSAVGGARWMPLGQMKKNSSGHEIKTSIDRLVALL